jgi:ParB family chromosome partitioning protein
LEKEMIKRKDRKGLGRGLSALMADIDQSPKEIPGKTSGISSNMLPIEKIIANPELFGYLKRPLLVKLF